LCLSELYSQYLMAIDPKYDTKCYGTLIHTMGLPCFHVMREILSKRGRLKKEDLSPFWYLDRVHNTICEFNFPGEGNSFTINLI
jgi:hypothetical protein